MFKKKGSLEISIKFKGAEEPRLGVLRRNVTTTCLKLAGKMDQLVKLQFIRLNTRGAKVEKTFLKSCGGMVSLEESAHFI